ncbi:MAG: hypothetical protein H6700_02975 [Myxococcales bacterium]|nr:hypothetical protein [Myxococcales bacterium]MCB9530704.1 hypothetical protein [Myxococcales bacterium]
MLRPHLSAIGVATLALAALGGCNDSVTGANADAAALDTSADGSGLPDVEDPDGADDTAAIDAPDLGGSDADPGDVGTDAGPEDADDDATDIADITLDTLLDGDGGGDDDADDDGGGDDADAEPPRPRWESAPPSANGPYEWSEFEESISAAGFDISLDLYVPTNAEDAPYPVVVFNHGFQMDGSMYAVYGRRLASHGFVAVLPSIGDTLISSRTHTELANIQVAVDAWIADAATRPGSRIYNVADVERLGAGGHSRGGKASIYAATRDPRIVASFNVDPVDSGPPFGGNPTDFPSVAPELMDDVTIPTGYIGSGLGGSGFVACAPTEDNYHQYFLASSSPTFEYVLPEAGHNDFIETCNFTCRAACAQGDDPAAALAFAVTTTVAFYKVYLADDESYLPWVQGDQVPTWVQFGAR